MYFLIFQFLIPYIAGESSIVSEKQKFCMEVDNCVDNRNKRVCGVKAEGAGFVFKIFDDECELLKYGCEVENDDDAYGIVNMEYCQRSTETEFNSTISKETSSDSDNEITNSVNEVTNSCSADCDTGIDTQIVCGIRQQGPGFKVRLFFNKCDMNEHNCENKVDFNSTDLYICDGLVLSRATKNRTEKTTKRYIEDMTTTKTTKHEEVTMADDYKESDTDTSTEDTVGIEDKIENTETDKSTSTEDDNEDKFEQIRKKRRSMNKEEELTQEKVPNESNSDNEETPNTDEETVTVNNKIVPKTTHVYGPATIGARNDAMKKFKKQKNLVIVDATLFDINGNVNDTINNFFAATHVFDMPLREVHVNGFKGNTRRRLVDIFGPVKVFQPWITIPKNKSTDVWHEPTLASCYHKCPTKCPETYAPVCGVPGVEAREPSIMFMNHCFMDAAQCKMRWEEKSSTAASSSYIESSFMICLGDTLSALYRFLPLVRTLQHMGRLRKKGKFHYKLRNFKYFNELLGRNPKIMGKR